MSNGIQAERELAYKSWARGTEEVTHDWTNRFLSEVATYNRLCNATESAEVLRKLVRTRLLCYTDMRDRPERFFAAHRLLAAKVLGGFGIRFTVQFNLFAGSILGLGGSEQIAFLDDLQSSGELGCFALTEVGAGVLSGFIVNTIAKWDPEQNGFVISTPNSSAEKNWISQGLVATWVVVFADLQIGEKSFGPHPFLLRMRDTAGILTAGISVTDMGTKTVANDLDNARIHFDKVFVPRTGLLNRFADMVNGEYVQVGEEPMRIEVIGQRLLTGRLAIAESAITMVRQLLLKTKTYANTKLVNSLKGPIPLAQLPYLNKFFKDADEQLTALETFTASVEARLAVHLRSGSIPDDDLVEAISVCKVRDVAVATAIEHQLEQEVGSYALMATNGFVHKDMLLCCQFAEGDSRILMQKMARDALKRAQKRGLLRLAIDTITECDSILRKRLWNTLQLAYKMSRAVSVKEGFASEWESVYELARSTCDAHVHLRPKGEEIGNLLRKHPDLLEKLGAPLLRSHL